MENMTKQEKTALNMAQFI
ncbi:Rop family plasmid primer RNA-binding protein, partial [Klebsiella pneumoniae]|nr:Rop family plasmid primer RNA-binding protein [Klebsiella pneumoniae]